MIQFQISAFDYVNGKKVTELQNGKMQIVAQCNFRMISFINKIRFD